MRFFGFGSKDEPKDAPVPPRLGQSIGKPPAIPVVPVSNSVKPPLQGGQVAPEQSESPPPDVPSIVFDATNIESIRASFVRMARAFDELKKLNEDHKTIQQKNLSLFEGVKDREIADLKKSLAGWQDAVSVRDKEIARQKEMLNDSTTDLNRLNADIHEKVLEIKRREDEVVGVRNDLAALEDVRKQEAADHGQTKAKLDELESQYNDLTAAKDLLIQEVATYHRRLEEALHELSSMTARLAALHESNAHRLAHYLPEGMLSSKVATQVLAFEEAASAGDSVSLRVMAGLTQLRAAFVSGSGPDDKLVSVKAIGMALYAAWSAQGKDSQAISSLFSEWQDYLNGIAGAGFQLVVPDLGQNIPQNVTAPAGATKVSEVQLWIVKGGNGAIYSKGVVR
jgi:hypothetical protein